MIGLADARPNRSPSIIGSGFSSRTFVRFLLAAFAAFALSAFASTPSVARAGPPDGSACSCGGGVTGTVCTNSGGIAACSCNPSTASGGTCSFGGVPFYLTSEGQRISELRASIRGLRQAIQDLRDMSPLTITPFDAARIGTGIPALQEQLAADEMELARLERNLPSQYAETPRLDRQSSDIFALADRVLQPATSLRPKPHLDNDRVKVSVFGSLDVERTSSSTVAGSSYTGARVLSGGGSATSALSGGGVSFDLSGPMNLGPDRSLRVAAGAWFGVSSSAVAPSLANAAGGGSRANGVIFGFGVGYGVRDNYIAATIAGGPSRASAYTNGAGTTGSFGMTALVVDLEGGHSFALWDATAGARAQANGWRYVSLNLAGHVGVEHARTNAYVDIFGQSNGMAGADSLVFGPRARLTALYVTSGVAFRPFAKLSVDFAPGAKLWDSTADTAATGLTPVVFPGDRIRARIESGLDVTLRGGVTLSSNVRYEATSTSRTIGGRIALKAPIL